MQRSNYVNWFFHVWEIEIVTTYESSAKTFIINTPCESAQKYWIKGATLVILFGRIFSFEFVMSIHFLFKALDAYHFSILDDAMKFISCYYNAYNLLLYMQYALHTIAFSQLLINKKMRMLMCFCQIWNENG